MRRVTTALLGTAVGTAVLVAVKAQLLPGAPPAVAAPQAPATAILPAAPPKGRAPVGVIDPARLFDGTQLGTPAAIPYGIVQVRITVSGGRLTDVVAVRLPTAAARGIELGRRAAPVLRAQALTRQSATLDTVSGATYTSDGYRRSLQSALDAAHTGRPAPQATDRR